MFSSVVFCHVCTLLVVLYCMCCIWFCRSYWYWADLHFDLGNVVVRGTDGGHSQGTLQGPQYELDQGTSGRGRQLHRFRIHPATATKAGSLPRRKVAVCLRKREGDVTDYDTDSSIRQGNGTAIASLWSSCCVNFHCWCYQMLLRRATFAAEFRRFAANVNDRGVVPDEFLDFKSVCRRSFFWNCSLKRVTRGVC